MITFIYVQAPIIYTSSISGDYYSRATSRCKDLNISIMYTKRSKARTKYGFCRYYSVARTRYKYSPVFIL